MNMKDQPTHPHGGDGGLRKVVEELAERLAQLEALAAKPNEVPPARDVSDETLARIARTIYRARQRREKFFPGDLFAEPAWDMLLDLFISKAQGKRVLTTSLCIAANVPQTTGLRWIAQLEQYQLVRRFSAPDDARIKLIELTPEGYRLMRRYVAEGMSRSEMPAPQ